MKLYTRTGDDGTTGLFSGSRVSKDHPRIAAYGTVDELNACLGLAIAGTQSGADDGDGSLELMRSILTPIQSRLFDIGADLATPEGAKTEAKIQRIDEAIVREIEQAIDRVEERNEPIRAFVMPGGSELAARLHVARTVCRRAEREIVALTHVEPVTTEALRYVNRLSDLLFAMSRLANKAAGVADVPWVPAKGRG